MRLNYKNYKIEVTLSGNEIDCLS